MCHKSGTIKRLNRFIMKQYYPSILPGRQPVNNDQQKGTNHASDAAQQPDSGLDHDLLGNGKTKKHKARSQSDDRKQFPAGHKSTSTFCK
jgi:hypothetical protein